jgi:hypothetical protein
MTADEEAVKEMLYSLFDLGPERAVTLVVETATTVDVVDIQRHSDGTYEVWMEGAGAWTGEELERIQTVFDVKEVGSYGDPLLRGTTEGSGLDGAFHAILDPKDG